MSKLTLPMLDSALDQAFESRKQYIAKLKEEPWNFLFFSHQIYLTDAAISVLLEEIEHAGKLIESWPAA